MRSAQRQTRWTEAIIARHETGAAFMADAYARNTGRLGFAAQLQARVLPICLPGCLFFRK